MILPSHYDKTNVEWLQKISDLRQLATLAITIVRGQEAGFRQGDDASFDVRVAFSRAAPGMAKDFLEMPGIAYLLGKQSAVGVTEGVDPKASPRTIHDRNSGTPESVNNFETLTCRI